MSKSAREALQYALKIQKAEPSVKYSPYMQGLLNGMWLAESFLDGKAYKPHTLEKQTLFKRVKRWWTFKFYKPKVMDCS